jgi:hypothetical protein
VSRGGAAVPALAVLALVLAALFLSACGDDDGGVSRQDYAQRVNRVCDEVERQLKELDPTGARTVTDVTALIDDVITKSRAAIDRLKSLERPTGDARKAADRFVETLDREFERDALPALADLKGAILTGNRAAAVDAADRLSKLENAASDRYARQLGADSCAA